MTYRCPNCASKSLQVNVEVLAHLDQNDADGPTTDIDGENSTFIARCALRRSRHTCRRASGCR